MKRSAEKTKHTFVHFLVYALGFLLVWEWLRPIPVVTNTGDIEVFVLFALFSFLMIFMKIPLYVMIPLLFAGSIYAIHLVFGEGSFLTREGGGASIRLFFEDVAYNFSLIASWNLEVLTDPFRTLLVLLLLSLVAYLIYFWIFHIKRIFFFLFATVVYVAVLDTFTAVDASMAIVRIVVIGFFLVSLLHMLSVQAKERKIGRRSASFMSTAWLYSLVFMILAATTVGYAAPKMEPQWSDPVPAFERWVTGEGTGSGGGIRRVGYGDNDERLGGGFVQDENPVFYAETDQPGYWRGESKHEYTGHGWVSEPDYRESETVYGEAVNYRMYTGDVETTAHTASLEMVEGAGFPNLFYPGQITALNTDGMTLTVNGDASDVTPQFYTDVVGGEVTSRTAAEDDDIRLTSYSVDYGYPSFDISSLELEEPQDPDFITGRFLQLPDELPERVVELAEEITEDADNRYEMAVAVEQYFRQNDFEYATSGIPVPEEGQDYVDQFLFESRIGYCDNYSTSMAVLLRAVDVPTRWVKGFTDGEPVETLDDDRQRYEVTNGNAHSWVEVYFPETGWVPFEPTQGFNNNVDFTQETEDVDVNSEDDQDQADIDRPDMPLEEDMMAPDDSDIDEGGAGAGGGGTGTGLSAGDWLSPKPILISIVALVLVMIMYEKKHRILNRYFLFHYKLFGNDARFTNAYHRALWLLDNEGIPRAEGETLREYARRVDHITGTMAMGRLTERYERMTYGGREEERNWREDKASWEELVNSLKF
ncbi:DUF4129 domain-containing transglutaminase family protein [Alteribacter natronophilus]|uniref:DUF4129 domain-containing transglutaminase family protein n=1 Tax=Alteribacter natronophilus TaxID=2583810 RepID=UPI00110E863A|nr:transglutaminase domain-containing protein [Alteribacter natronophilus]TMW71090.1 transglutaminase domain-containing protein [Alteribacter natronophilus]